MTALVPDLWLNIRLKLQEKKCLLDAVFYGFHDKSEFAV